MPRNSYPVTICFSRYLHDGALLRLGWYEITLTEEEYRYLVSLLEYLRHLSRTGPSGWAILTLRMVNVRPKIRPLDGAPPLKEVYVHIDPESEELELKVVMPGISGPQSYYAELPIYAFRFD